VKKITQLLTRLSGPEQLTDVTSELGLVFRRIS